jgi:hypothetical protein
MRSKMLAAACAVLFCLVAAPAFAVDYMLGAKAGYYVWEPFYKDGMGASGMSDIKYGTGMLAGPVFSMIFTQDLSLSLAGMAGRQSTHWLSTFSEFETDTEVSGCYYFDALRIDLDAALSYRLSESFKVFLGYKYLYLSVDYKYSEMRTDPTNLDYLTESRLEETKFVTPFHGPAVGIGYSLLLSERVFMAINASAMYMRGYLSMEDSASWELSETASPVKGGKPMPRVSMEQIGCNIEPSIGFNPGSGLPIITLGLRYQLLRIRFTERTLDFVSYNKWYNDSLYGVFVSAVYAF